MELEVSGLEWVSCPGQGPDGGDIIVSFAQLHDNTTVSLRIEDYPLHYYWLLPTNYEWDFETCSELHKVLNRCLGQNSRYMLPMVSDDIFLKERLYYYSEDKYPALRFRFITQDAARHASNILKKGLMLSDDRIHGDVVEFDIGHVRKLLTDIDITHCQWFKCVGRQVSPNEKVTTLDQEYRVKYRTIRSSDCKLVPRPLFCSYDIEEYSNNHNKFPEAWDSRDDINMMSVVFARDGDAAELWAVYVIVVCDYILTKEQEENSIVLRVEDRIELIKTFAALVNKHNPDIFTGYNILAFDNKHILAKLGIYGEKMPNIGRMLGAFSDKDGVNWSSSANKGKDLHWFKAPGRAFVDFYEHCTRNEKWPVYTLDHACKAILSKFPELRKKPIAPKEQFRIYKAVLDTNHLPRDDPERIIALKDMGKFVEYCKFDSTLVLHMAWITNWWIGLREMCNAVGSGLQDLLTRGQQNRVLSLLYHHCTKEGIVLDKRAKEEIFYYEGGLVQQPQLGVTDLSPTLDFKSLYPSVMIGYNLSHNTLIHPDNWHKYTEDQVIIAKPLVGDQDIDSMDDFDAKKLKLEEIAWEEAEFHFIKKEVKEGVVPKILKLLLSERARVRGLQKTVERGSTMWVVYEQRQLALKVCANSIYGFMGVKRGGKRSCLEISATTTYFGRERITYTIDWIIDNAHKIITEYYKEKGWELIPNHVYTAELVYGDTDSCMMHFPGVPLEHIYPLSYHISSLATREHTHLGPLELEMEGVFKICCIAQKHYAKFLYNNPSEGKPDIYESEDGKPLLHVKGLTPVRRDSCDYVRNVMSDILYTVMTGGTYGKCLDIFLRSVRDLYMGNIPTEKLIITKSMGAHYKNANATMNVFAQQMAVQGQTINPGERHEFIVVNNPGEKKVAMKMVLVTLYNATDERKRAKIDAEYYFGNLLKKKIDRLFGAIFHRHAKKCNSMSLTLAGRTCTGLSPGKMLATGLRAGKCDIFRDMSEGGRVIDGLIAKSA